MSQTDQESTPAPYTRDDDLQVERWRIDRLLRMGVPLRLALTTAVSPVDLHELERLIGQGCSPRVAVDILL